MLVLSRKEDEVVCIGDDITVTVVEIRGDKVRIGVNAPQNVPVHRQEVYEAIHAGPERAAEVSAYPSHCDKCQSPLLGNRHPLNDRLCKQCGLVS